VRHRIIGGDEAKPGDAPYLVSLQWFLSWKRVGIHFCGGAIITKLWILSASHCLDDMPMLDEHTTFVVVAGKFNITDVESSEQKLVVHSIYKHEKYDKSK
jgi:secreted trypsin-like serine protease